VKSSSLKKEFPALQSFKFLQLRGVTFASLDRIRISNADPDTADQNESGSGCTTLVYSKK
jgi:hypothetical protein